MTAISLPHDVTISSGALRVLHNMGEKMLSVRRPVPTETESIQEYRSRLSDFEADRAEMARSLGVALKHIANPEVRLWPDNSSEDCLSLCGSVRGLQFGIIFRAKDNGTGTWSFHS